MYPSISNVRYGIFVKRFEEAIEKDFEIKKTVKNKKKSAISKFFAYASTYLKIVLLAFKIKKGDLIYLHYPLYFAPLLPILKASPGKIVLNFHGSDMVIDSLFKRALFVFLKGSLNECFIVVPSKSYKKLAQDTLQVLEERILIYPSGGINKQIFHPLDKALGAHFTIGFVSNFLRTKGWPTLLNALGKLKEMQPDLQFRSVMVGDGPDKREIEQQINKHNLEIDVISSVPQQELAKIYSTFDVLVFPSLRESLGLVGIEAMMCGIPVIASDIEGPNGYIIHGYNGYLFENQDAQH